MPVAVFSFGTDWLTSQPLRFMVFAAASALRTDIARERIVNCMAREELLDWVRDVRERHPEGADGLRWQKKAARSMTDPQDLASTHDDGKIQVVIETPKGSRNKYAFDPEQQDSSL